MPPTQPDILSDRQPPYRSRVFVRGYADLDPLALPWKEMRRSPADFPDRHVAKVSSARTVVGLDWAPSGAPPERIYLKRSLHRHPVDKFLSLFRDSKEWREFQLALKFREAGILVPDPLYYSEAIDAEGHRAVFLATRALDRDWIEAKTFFKAERRFAAEWESLARFTRELHQRGILHADYRSDHLYLHRGRLAAGNDLATWALIDLDGSRTGIAVTARQRDRALRQLAESLLTSGLTEPDLAAFLRLYDPDNRHHLDPAAIHAFAKGRHKAKG